MSGEADPDFWRTRRVLITGGRGFLGRAVLDRLSTRDPGAVIAPSSTDYDLRDRAAVTAMYAETEPDVVIHLAARVGGIGANMVRPAELYLDNLLMGTYVLDEARLRHTPKSVIVGTICSYPKFTPVPFEEELPLAGLPRGDQRPLRHRQAGPARPAAGQPGAVRPERHLPHADQPLRPPGQVPSAVSHVIPALIKKAVDAKERGADHIEVWGTGSASREFLFVDDAAEGIVLAAERYDDDEPVNLGADRELPIRDLVEIIVKLVGFEGEVRWDTTKPDGQPRRAVDATRARERFGFVAGTPFDEGLRLTLDWYLTHRTEAEARPV